MNDSTQRREILQTSTNHSRYPAFVFKSGRTTLQMQVAKGQDLKTLKTWLSDIELAFRFPKDLLPADCGILSAATFRIESALLHEHNKRVPWHLVNERAEARIKWLLKNI